MTEPALSVTEAAAALRAGETTSEALTARALERIAEKDGAVNAFVRLDAEGAMEAARAADAERAAGRDRGPMHGVPYAIKDIYDVAGMPTTCHSRLRLDAVATRDCAVVERFRAAGAVLLGKLGTYEFALGGPSFDLPFPPPRNPWDLSRVPGGSSSGSGAAIAAGYVAVAPGSCTAGSIRGPAAFCGTVGLKPTYGRVSRRGVFPLAWSLDHVGPLTRGVRDAAVALQIMAGHDPEDPGSADRPVPDYATGLEDGVLGLSVGVPRAFFDTAPELSDDMRGGIEAALACLRDEGATVHDVTLPDHALYLAVGRILMAAEAHAIHRTDLRTRLEQYGAITARRFSIGAAISAADYIDSQRLRRSLSAAVDAALVRHDVLVTAISLSSPPELVDGDGLAFAAMQATPFNVSGHPAISVPVGLGRDGMPLAVQVVGRPFDEARVLRVARALERATGWERQALPG